jgi:hypothetical protein
MEELERTKPKTVSELIEIASRFADGEDAYNNKREHSLEGDEASRQRCRSHNKDGRIRRNQVAAGYERVKASLLFQEWNFHSKVSNLK